MDSLTKYSPAILNNNGNLEASMCVTNIGEYVKLSDIKELLNSSHNKQSTPCPFEHNHGAFKGNGLKYCHQCGIKL